MKISVVTAVYNSQRTCVDAIRSVASQTTFQNIEYITVDGMSDDGTADVISEHSDVIHQSIRETDTGIYDALNKGIAACTGDVIGFLHADDLLADDQAIERVRDKFSTGDFEAVYADLTYVDFDDPNRVIRYWRSGKFSRRRFWFGWMPPHPTVYVRRDVYEKYGNYRTDHGSAADYECMVRLMVRNQIKVGYVPHVTVKMRVGGESNASWRNRLKANQADRKAWLENGMAPPIGLRFTKPLSKIPQYFCKSPLNTDSPAK